QLDMAKYFSFLVGQEVKPTDKVVIYAKNYFEKIGAVIAATSKEVLQNYIVMQTIRNDLRMVPAPLHVVRDTFGNGMGWDYSSRDGSACIQRTLERLKFATAAMFAQDRFMAKDRAEIEDLIKNIKKSFEITLPNMEWMDDATKAAALEKVGLMLSQIGYPDWITDVDKLDAYYANVDITLNEFANTINLGRAAFQNNVKYYGLPVDRNRWRAVDNPTLAGAYNEENQNVLVLFVGILQEPFYGYHYPKALLYGMIGSLISQIFVHGFDEIGHKYNGIGQSVDWWTQATAAAYDEKAQCYLDQYNNITVRGGKTQVNGEFTLGENIADNGAVVIAYNAYRLYREMGGKDETLPGLDLSSNQLFFLGYTQNWCARVTDDFMKVILMYDYHSPNVVRGEVPLMNSKRFAQTFKCRKGSRMNPEERCQMWPTF
ncbi:hypothetical protein CAPTEDRAFT_107899, partial [Capitella teleta]